jgi:hypothetical protein
MGRGAEGRAEQRATSSYREDATTSQEGRNMCKYYRPGLLSTLMFSGSNEGK